MLYIMQLIGFLPFGSTMLQNLVQVLPIFAAVLIMLTGLGVLSYSPAARRRRKARKRAARRRRQRRSQQAKKTMGRAPRADAAGRRAASAFAQAEKALGAAGHVASQAAGRAITEAKARRRAARKKGRTRLLKDRKNRKLTGLAGGMANYFGVDPTVVRALWIIATMASSGGAIAVYIILSMVTGNDEEDAVADDPLIRVTR